ncbi:glutathione S-transferase P 1 [Patella vulgata]|uniref:glutathione S-transferase P 1 n=1 Tax=Patella vulgata TaxID=6465 RepID=UPI00217FEA9C|nr:glutathione S-transferase P 1 [Patella vulgata]
MAYRLEYFDVRGRGESIRYLLKDNELVYDEVLIDFADWPKYKPKMPYGQAPAFYSGDTLFVQSNSILRYLGRKHDMYPSDPVTAYQVDMLNDGVEDLRNLYVKLIYQNYEAGKEEYVKALPERLQPFENILKANGAVSSGFAVAGKVSFVDYNLYDLLDIQVLLSPTCLDTLPTLKAYYNAFNSRPRLAAYRQTEAFKKRNVNGNGKQ